MALQSEVKKQSLWKINTGTFGWTANAFVYLRYILYAVFDLDGTEENVVNCLFAAVRQLLPIVGSKTFSSRSDKLKNFVFQK